MERERERERERKAEREMGEIELISKCELEIIQKLIFLAKILNSVSVRGGHRDAAFWPKNRSLWR